MKYHTYLFFNLFLLISSLFLSACGGSSSGSGAVNTDTDRPQFFREKATSSPSYSPSGETTDTTPTFSWKAINNATDYQIGHEGTEDASTWHKYDTSPSDAGCEQVGSTCTLTPSDYTFPLNVEKVWWVRAKVNGDWQDWSSPIIFTVVSGGGSNADIPKLIEPINNEVVFNLNSFSVHWLKARDKSGIRPFYNLYKVGFENADTGENWQEHDINCYRPSRLQPKDCSRSISVNGFTYGQNIAWWVKAKVDGEWGEWSEAGTFTISSNTNMVPKIIEPIIVTNSVYLNLKWSRVVAASKYRFATEDADTGENYKVYSHSNFYYTIGCLIGRDFCNVRIKFPSGKNLNWWVQPKINGEWGEWSDVGYISTQFSSVNNIPDEVYKLFCHVYDRYPPIVEVKLDLIDGIIINERRYFINPTDEHTIKISNLDGTNEHSVATFDMKSGEHLIIPISKNGALFVHIDGKGVFLIRENNPPLQVVKALERHRMGDFVYTKNYVFYMFKVFSRHHPASLALHRVSLTGDETTLVSNYSKGTDESDLDVFYSKEEGNLYFLNIDNYNRRIGRIDDNGEIEYLSSCQ